MTGQIPPETLRLLRLGRDIHADQYRSNRLPFGVTEAHGVRKRLVELDGPHSGRSFEAIDATGGYGSACLGAGHPVVRDSLVRGITEAGYATDEVGSLERSLLLAELFGPNGLWTDHFPAGDYHVSGRSSGSEGMELALRLVLESRVDQRTLRPARDKEMRDLIVAFEGAWHGWTSGLVPLLNRRHYRAGLPEPAADGPAGIRVQHLPFGDTGVIEDFFTEFGHRVLAVFVEPIQGDAGVLISEPGFLRALSDLARGSGALLVADEVLTFAKTGAFLAMADEYGPIPTDVTVIGKNIGMGAIPLSMVIARRSLSVRASGGVATSDLRPLACAVVRDCLRYIRDDGLLERTRTAGERIGELVRTELVDRYPDIYREERGIGFMRGVELTEQAAAASAQLREHVVRAGAYVEFMAGAGKRSRGLRYVFPTLRITPPLVSTDDDLAELIDRIAAGSEAFANRLVARAA
ncbi:MAG TPA: aminotransferase class III-fold pyridoxal phosphate-dependent enzyme [Pseudonocardiaceae bacterium]|nr:aminotransferase class III-fold pyridoxal phosphate-dependent enzyme [Pseudonocardiaceae bacterium]